MASDWSRHFRRLLFKRWIEVNETWQEARSQRPRYEVGVFSGRSENKDGRPGLWLSEPLSTSLKPLIGIQRNFTVIKILKGSKISTSSTKFGFLAGPIRKPRPLIIWAFFDISSTIVEWKSIKHNMNTDLNVLYQAYDCRADRKPRSLPLPLIGLHVNIYDFSSSQRNLTKSKNSTSSTQFLFWSTKKTKMVILVSDWLRHFLFPLSSCLAAELNSTNHNRKQDLRPLPNLGFRVV